MFMYRYVHEFFNIENLVFSISRYLNRTNIKALEFFKYLVSEMIEEEAENKMDNNEVIDKPKEVTCIKPAKKGIIYLSTIPPYMNVTQIREYFEKFGTVCRIYLQLDQKVKTTENKPKPKRRTAKKFVEGWIEFERKHIAKKVACLLTNTRVSDRKKSKQYDHIWNIKYLKNFKWAHLHERLAYEKAARRQKLQAEIQLAKKKSHTFSANLDKMNRNKKVVNKEYENLDQEIIKNNNCNNYDNSQKNRTEFLSALF